MMFRLHHPELCGELGVNPDKGYNDPKFIAWAAYIGLPLKRGTPPMFHLVDDANSSLGSLRMAVYLKQHMPWEWDKFSILWRMGIVTW